MASLKLPVICFQNSLYICNCAPMHVLHKYNILWYNVWKLITAEKCKKKWKLLEISFPSSKLSPHCFIINLYICVHHEGILIPSFQHLLKLYKAHCDIHKIIEALSQWISAKCWQRIPFNPASKHPCGKKKHRNNNHTKPHSTQILVETHTVSIPGLKSL